MHASLRAAGAIPLLFVTFAAAAGEDAANPDEANLDQIVVTAELRDRELRNLPASATVLDAHTL